MSYTVRASHQHPLLIEGFPYWNVKSRQRLATELAAIILVSMHNLCETFSKVARYSLLTS